MSRRDTSSFREIVHDIIRNRLVGGESGVLYLRGELVGSDLVEASVVERQQVPDMWRAEVML